MQGAPAILVGRAVAVKIVLGPPDRASVRTTPRRAAPVKEMLMAVSFSTTRVAAFWGRLNSSFWFVPTVMAIAAVALSFVFIEIDALSDVSEMDNPSALHTFGP